ncbi:M23 family metallopeptidase [Erythrobacter sp. NE805]|uniref:M23 family metallopeptidase n=1 Tax=Erythrobacter sp. NE805 TaxID=3389875 RepID=UPI00396B2797
MTKSLSACLFLFAASASATGPAESSLPAHPVASATASPIVVHPVFDVSFVCSYHPEGQLAALGDALGTDCLVTSVQIDEGGTGWSRPYVTDGTTNEDWYGWNRPVLAPISGEVVEVYVNDKVNRPGVMQPGRASSVVIAGADGLRVVIAHVQAIRVRTGAKVTAGEEIARVGNNGFSRNPHIHLGAYRDGVAVPLFFDPVVPVRFLVNGEVYEGQ